MSSLLSGRRALVTGASRGIGAAIATALAAEGARVAINYVGAAGEAQSVAEGIVRAGGEALCVQADVADEDQVTRMFQTVIDAWGSLDLVVNNAGIQRDAPVADMTRADWQRVIDVNLTGQFLCAREAVRVFRRRPASSAPPRAHGTILCVSSVHQVIPWAGHVNYAASKGGVDMLVKTLAQELAPERIRVVSIAPGAIETSINRAAWQTPEARAALREVIPYGRIGSVDDIARAAVWLASDAADYITGSTLFVDGGMTLYPAFREGG